MVAVVPRVRAERRIGRPARASSIAPGTRAAGPTATKTRICGPRDGPRRGRRSGARGENASSAPGPAESDDGAPPARSTRDSDAPVRGSSLPTARAPRDSDDGLEVRTWTGAQKRRIRARRGRGRDGRGEEPAKARAPGSNGDCGTCVCVAGGSNPCSTEVDLQGPNTPSIFETTKDCLSAVSFSGEQQIKGCESLHVRSPAVFTPPITSVRRRAATADPSRRDSDHLRTGTGVFL